MPEATLSPDKIQDAIEVLEPWTGVRVWTWSFQGKRAIEVALLAMRAQLEAMRGFAKPDAAPMPPRPRPRHIGREASEKGHFCGACQDYDCDVSENDAPPRPAQKCTGFAASWCPRCGDCSCPRLENGELKDAPGADRECPLHGDQSLHQEPPEEPLEALATIRDFLDRRYGPSYATHIRAALATIEARLREVHGG